MTAVLGTAVLALASGPAQAAQAGAGHSVGERANLRAVTAITPKDVWAVGDYSRANGDFAPLAATYNGSNWQNRHVSAPRGAVDTYLTGVAASSASNVWVVGDYQSANGNLEPLTERWTGSRWSIVASPVPDSSTVTHVTGVSAPTANDVWVSGYYKSTSGAADAFTEQWNGKTWQHFTSLDPASATNTYLTGVAATSASIVWIVGDYQTANGSLEPLTEKWASGRWSIVASPVPDNSTATHVTGVSAPTANGAWLSGYYKSASGSTDAFTEQWDGKTWAIAPPLNSRGATDSYLFAVSAATPTDVWAVGVSSSAATHARALIARWNGTSWGAPTAPAPRNSTGTHLEAVSASKDSAFVVGTYNLASGGSRPLAEGWNGTTWKVWNLPTS